MVEELKDIKLGDINNSELPENEREELQKEFDAIKNYVPPEANNAVRIPTSPRPTGTNVPKPRMPPLQRRESQLYHDGNGNPILSSVESYPNYASINNRNYSATEPSVERQSVNNYQNGNGNFIRTSTEGIYEEVLEGNNPVNANENGPVSSIGVNPYYQGPESLNSPIVTTYADPMEVNNNYDSVRGNIPKYEKLGTRTTGRVNPRSIRPGNYNRLNKNQYQSKVWSISPGQKQQTIKLDDK